MTDVDEMEEVYNQFITKYVNQYGRDTEATFIRLFRREHPTLQQSFVRLVMTLAKSLSEEPPYTDGRNEGAIELMIEFSKLEYFLPLI